MQTFSNYVPKAQVLSQLKGVHFVGVVGPTAVGKTTLMHRAMHHDTSLHMVRVTTSRTPRPGERDGVDYYFRDKHVMLERIARHEYVQVAPALLGELYATDAEAYGGKGTALMAIIADSVPLFRSLPFASCTIVGIVPPSFAVWQQRVQAHGFTPAQYAARMQEAVRSFAFMASDPGIACVVNDDIDVTTEQFLSVVQRKLAPAVLLRPHTLIADIQAQLPKL